MVHISLSAWHPARHPSSMMIRSVRGEVMALFWIVHEIDGERRIFFQEAGALIFARLNGDLSTRNNVGS